MQEETNNEGERALAKVAKETGISADEQLQLIRDGMTYVHDMTTRVTDLLGKREDTKQHLIAANLADKNSQREYDLASKQLDMLEKVLTAHFAERKSQIEGGFRIIDEALKEGNWDKVAQVYGDMSAMVAQSPLAAAVALNTKMKSGKEITLDDF